LGIDHAMIADIASATRELCFLVWFACVATGQC